VFSCTAVLFFWKGPNHYFSTAKDVGYSSLKIPGYIAYGEHTPRGSFLHGVLVSSGRPPARFYNVMV
jgi:hypothetical protein